MISALVAATLVAAQLMPADVEGGFAHDLTSLSPNGGRVEPGHLSPEVVATRLAGATYSPARKPVQPTNLAAAIEQVERELIQATLDRTNGNISEAARTLGLTRRGLYLKLRRLGFDSQAEDTA